MATEMYDNDKKGCGGMVTEETHEAVSVMASGRSNVELDELFSKMELMHENVLFLVQEMEKLRVSMTSTNESGGDYHEEMKSENKQSKLSKQQRVYKKDCNKKACRDDDMEEEHLCMNASENESDGTDEDDEDDDDDHDDDDDYVEGDGGTGDDGSAEEAGSDSDSMDDFIVDDDDSLD
jgi:hypothetical protein